MKTRLLALLGLMLLLGSCASRYKKVNPQAQVYNSINASNGVSIEYKYEVLQGKYKRKESRKKARLVSVKITNNSGSDKVVGQNLRFAYLSGQEIIMLDNEALYNDLKQHPATHLFYLLLTPLNGYVTTSSPSGTQTSGSTIPIGLVIGPGLTLFNMLKASGANRKFKKELAETSLYGKTIKNGETVYGLIGVRSATYDALQVKVIE